MSAIKKQVFGISDSASLFRPAWQSPDFFQLMASLAPAGHSPSILYVGAAKGDNPQRIAEFYEIALRYNCTPRVLSLFEMTTNNSDEYFAGADIIYFDGGSSKNLLALLAAWDAMDALKTAYENGVVIAGASAGLCILFDWCITDSVKTKILPMPGMGLLRGSVCVHHNIRADRRDVFQSFVNGADARFPAYALDDGTAMHFINGVLKSTYSLSQTAHCRQMENAGAGFTEAAVNVLPPDATANALNDRSKLYKLK